MADPIPLEFQDKRRVLLGKGQEAGRRAVAEALLAQGRLCESLEYLERTRDEVPLKRVVADAIRTGDVLAYARASHLLKAETKPAEWKELAEAAKRAERWFEAILALEKGGEQAAADALRAEKCPDFQPLKPANK